LFAKSKLDFQNFNSNLDVDFKSNTQNRSFNATLKLRTDSAFAGTIKIMSIVGASYLVSTDSIIFVNKWSDCYYRESLSLIEQMFGTEVEFEFFQSLILGLPIGLDDNTKYKEIHDKFYHVLSSHRKSKFKKIDKDRQDRLKDETGDILIQYYMDCDSYDLKRVDIQLPADTTSISIQYLERELIDGFNAPKSTIVNIAHPRDSVTIKLDYSSSRINEIKEISINIPESYEECD
jgi:hypothetical protein